MKKITSVAIALAMATAFCGMCAGCASNIAKEAASADGTVAVEAASTPSKVVLNPGWYYNGSAKVANTVTGLPVAAADTYHVDNGYLLDPGTKLPEPTTTRKDVQFAGWRYSKDGELITLTTAPSSLNGDLYLYAHWIEKVVPVRDIQLTELSAAFRFKDITVVIKLDKMPEVIGNTWKGLVENSQEVFLGTGDWNKGENRYALDGTSTYTINMKMPDTIYVGFTQDTGTKVEGKYAAVKKSDLSAEKINVVKDQSNNNYSAWTNGNNWDYIIDASSDIVYKD